MGFDRRFTLALVAWIAALLATLLGFVEALQTPGLAAARILAGLLVVAVFVGLWRHVERTNRTVARFVEALRFGDVSVRFDGRGGAGFGVLGAALDLAMRNLRADRDRSSQELRFYEALVDDAPVALLTVDAEHGVRLVNKAARRLFTQHQGTRPEDFTTYGETFAMRLVQGRDARLELLILRFPTGPQRAIFHAAALSRLGVEVRAIAVQPVQGTLDAVEMTAQTDLVRVLTHEILNSLTPVTSLASAAATVLDAEPPDIDAARTAMTTLVRRAEGLRHFIDSYRAVAHPIEVKRQEFAAEPFARELARLFSAEWPRVEFRLDVPNDLVLEADPDLLAQALINLLRNAAQASGAPDRVGQVRLSFSRQASGHVEIGVEDNGPGIPDALRNDVFLPFFTTRRGGTGVGLNLVRQIVVAHGWTIDVGRSARGGAAIRISIG